MQEILVRLSTVALALHIAFQVDANSNSLSNGLAVKSSRLSRPDVSVHLPREREIAHGNTNPFSILVLSSNGAHTYAKPASVARSATLDAFTGRIANVEDYRLSADGADWGPALQRAHDALAAGAGGEERVNTPGDLKINTQVVFSKSAPFIKLHCASPATMLTVGPSLGDTPMFSIGGTTAPGGMPASVEDCGFGGLGSNAGIAFTLRNANAMTFRNVVFSNLRIGIDSSNGYALTIEGGQADRVSTLFHSSTSAHHFILRSFKAYGGFHVVDLNGATDNVSIIENDFEGVRGAVVQVAGGTALRFSGNYIEYMLGDPLRSTAPLYGPDVTDNWFALGAMNWSVDNWNGGEFKGNSIYNQSITWGSSVDVEVGDNRVVGAGGVINGDVYLAGYVQPTKYQLPKLLNFWTQQPKHSSIGFRRGRDGRVYLRGNLINTTSGVLGKAAFKLPAAYRPSTFRTFLASNSAFGITAVSINRTGEVVINAAPGAGTSASPYQAGLDGISFEPMT